MSEAREKARALLAYATPGPWSSQREVALFPNAYVVGCPESTVIARVSRSSEQCMVAPKRARPEHDAALIAAAPGLLAALCDENDALRAELAETTDERNAAWRALHEILSKCVEGLGDSASVIVESVAVNLLRDEVKRLKEKA